LNRLVVEEVNNQIAVHLMILINGNKSKTVTVEKRK